MSKGDLTTSVFETLPSAWDLSSLVIVDGSAVEKPSGRVASRALDESSIFAAIHRDLPQISHSYLNDDKFLGSGSMFHVNRAIYDDKTEPRNAYYVAVRYMRLEREKNKEQTIQGLLRELRVLTHPFLRGHPHILSAFGYGWAEPGSSVIRPFLVFPYAEFGTLSEFLKAHKSHREITIAEKHELALQVALGLKALHDCGFVHGDLKADNVLILTFEEPLGHTSGYNENGWVAKIADFGSSFTLADLEEGTARYLGTDKYNAPEIQQGDIRSSNMEERYELCKRADVYSYGLLVWETMIGGLCYLDSISDIDKPSSQRHWKDYLRVKHDEPGNRLAEIAINTCQEQATEAIDTPVFRSIETVLRGCLKKMASERMPLKISLRTLEDVSWHVSSGPLT